MDNPGGAIGEAACERAITLLLVRHGETAFNAERRYQGQRDIPLSGAGRAQVRRLAHRLQAAWREVGAGALPGPPVAVYASDLRRAAETATMLGETVAEATGRPLPVRFLPHLRERHFGMWEGLTGAEVASRFPGGTSPEGAEAWPEVWTRMNEALEAIWRETALPTGTVPAPVVLIAGHGGSLRVFICRALGIGPEHIRRFRLDNASLSIADLSGTSPAQSEGRITLLNDTAHLQP